MNLSSKNKIFELKVNNYQYPELIFEKYDYYDSNWLMINCFLNDEGKEWTFIDPCLLTFELEQLIDWFEHLSRKDYSENSIEFIEPILAFEITNEIFRIRLAAEGKPGWISGEDDYTLDFELPSINFVNIINQLKIELNKFPKR